MLRIEMVVSFYFLHRSSKISQTYQKYYTFNYFFIQDNQETY